MHFWDFVYTPADKTLREMLDQEELNNEGNNMFEPKFIKKVKAFGNKAGYLDSRFTGKKKKRKKERKERNK